MTITAKVIAHSRASGAPNLITLQCRYPRFIHAEFMTHRVFSRNASSSRAIPIERMIQDVIDDPAMPVAWGSNKPGMQAGDEVPHWPVATECWLDAMHAAVERAKELNNLGLHKQIVNRLLEPFGHISVVVTATEWDNFFALRCHPDADPTMRALAEAMRDAIAGSTAVKREWHLPYISEMELAAKRPFDGKWLAMISAARCARVSYLNHDGTSPDIEKDLLLAKRLLESKHMSPSEHQAIAAPGTKSGNFVGWSQYRQMLENQ